MRSPVAVYERRRKAEAGIATRWLRIKAADRREGPDKRSRRQRQAGDVLIRCVDGMAPVYQLPVTRRPGDLSF